MPADDQQHPRPAVAALRRVCLAVAVLSLAAMTWAAAHDILADEPDLTAEWTFLAFAVLLCGCWLMGRAMRRPARTR